MGLLYYSIESINSCKGEYCIITEVNCNGTIIDNSTLNNGPASIATNKNCFVTKMMCYDEITTENNMLEQHNASYCMIEKLFCDSRERRLDTVNNYALFSRCFAQVKCESNYKRYGYKFYGWYCKQDEIECSFNNGTTIIIDINTFNTTNIDDLNLLNNCTIINRECDTNEVYNNGDCYNITKYCNGDIINNCVYEQLKIIDCNNNTLINDYCKINKIKCNGTEIQIDNYIGNIKDCELEEIECNDGIDVYNISTLLQNQHICTTQQMMCNGIEINNMNNFIGPYRNCMLTQIKCKNNNIDNCTLYEIGCEESADCKIKIDKYKCASNVTCEQRVNISSCICPIDRTNGDCSGSRSLNCTVVLVSPTLNCENNEYVLEKQKDDTKANLLDGDPPCLLFKLKETAELQYKLYCKFLNPNETIDPKVLGANFTYFIQNENFSVSTETTWEMKFKIFNFNVLSDNGASFNQELNLNQMVGEESIWFNISIGNVPDRFWAGNRLYGEVSWLKAKRPLGVIRNILDKKFLDSTEYKGKGTDISTSNTLTLVLAIVIPISILILFIIYQVLKRKKFIL